MKSIFDPHIGFHIGRYTVILSLLNLGSTNSSTLKHKFRYFIFIDSVIITEDNMKSV